jgi:WD40 repeat protein
VRVWDLDSFRVVFACDATAWPPAISPDGRRIVTVEPTPDGRRPGGGLTLWDVDRQKPLCTRRSEFARCKFTPDGSRVAVLARGAETGALEARSEFAVLVVLDASNGAELLTVRDRVGEGPMAFSPDGKLLAATARPTEGPAAILVWDVASGKELSRLKGHSGYVRDLAFAPDGRRLASVATTSTPGSYEVKLWDVATGSEFLHVKRDGPLRAGINNCLSFSPDGHRLLGRDLSRADGSVETIWDATPRPEESAPR